MWRVVCAEPPHRRPEGERAAGGRSSNNLIVYRQWDFLVPEIGQTFTDPSFVSSSLLPEIAAERPSNVFATIRVPAGTPAIYLGEPGRGLPGYEHEILLRRNTRFRVLSKTMRGGKLFVELEVIP